MKLVSRIKKIQEELSSLTEQCRELLSAKQVLFLNLRNFRGFSFRSLNFLKLREIFGVDLCLFIDFIFQDLIDKATTTLVGNRNLLQRMQTSTGIPLTSDSDDPAFTNFNQVSFLFSNSKLCLFRNYICCNE